MIKAFVYINKVDATINVLLTNEAIKESISKIGDGKGKEFLDVYEYMSVRLSLASPTVQGLLAKKAIKDIAFDYISLGNAWELIKDAPEVKTTLSQKEIESVSMDIKSIIEILEHEDIVE